MAQLIIGLDIGTSAVRAAELDVAPSTPVLHTYGQVGLPPGSVVDGEIRDHLAVTEAIKRLWANGQFSSSKVVVGVAGLRAITREFDLPYVPDAEVDSAVRFQSEEVIPFPPEQTLLSSQVLTDYTDSEGKQMRRVLVAAAHTDLINGIVDAVESAGLRIERIDLDSSAMVRALAAQSMPGQPEAIVSVGAGLTVVVIQQDGRPQFVRTIGMGGNAATASISGALDIPLPDAEMIKRRLGEGTPQVQAAIRPAESASQELVNEIRSSIQYFASLPGRSPVSRVLVTGGGAYLHGFLSMLEASVHLPIQLASPLQFLDMSKVPLTLEQAAQVGAVLTTPIGLTLPDRTPGGKLFNLMPPELAKRARIHSIQQYTAIAAAVVVLLVAFFGGYREYQVHQANNTISGLNTTISTLHAETLKYSIVDSATAAYNSANSQRAAVLAASIDWPRVYQSLLDLTPSGIGVISIVGTTNAANKPPASTGGAPVAASIGSITVSLEGPGPGLVSPKAWTDAISPPGRPTSTLFANPVINSVTTNDGSHPSSLNSVTFPSTISVVPAASLANNEGLQ